MERRIKVCFLGGSALATPKIFEDMAALQASAAYDFVMTGRDEERLELVKKISNALVSKISRLDVRVSTSTKIEASLEGADFIINQIRVGGRLKGVHSMKLSHVSLAFQVRKRLGRAGFPARLEASRSS